MSEFAPSGLFQVLVVGQSEGMNNASLDELKKRLSSTTVDRKAIFKLSADQPVAIKENVSFEIAEQFIKTLKIIGVNCWSEPMPELGTQSLVSQNAMRR